MLGNCKDLIIKVHFEKYLFRFSLCSRHVLYDWSAISIKKIYFIIKLCIVISILNIYFQKVDHEGKLIAYMHIQIDFVSTKNISYMFKLKKSNFSVPKWRCQHYHYVFVFLIFRGKKARCSKTTKSVDITLSTEYATVIRKNNATLGETGDSMLVLSDMDINKEDKSSNKYVLI